MTTQYTPLLEALDRSMAADLALISACQELREEVKRVLDWCNTKDNKNDK